MLCRIDGKEICLLAQGIVNGLGFGARGLVLQSTEKRHPKPEARSPNIYGTQHGAGQAPTLRNLHTKLAHKHRDLHN
jgi:hypothetical protein